MAESDEDVADQRATQRAEPRAEHWRKLRGVYLGSPTNSDGRTRIEVMARAARVELDVHEGLFHAASPVHGAHVFKLLDDAAFFAANSIVEDVFVLTVSFTVQFMRPASSGVLTAHGRVTNASKRVLWAEAEVLDAEGRTIARGSGTFMPSRIPLEPGIGYE